jgi:endonuclease III
MKRTSARLVAKQSQSNSSITFFHLEGANDGSGSGESPKRPTKRIRLERESNDVPSTASEPSAGKGKDKVVTEDVEGPKESITITATSPRKKVKQIQQALSKPHPAPAKWQEQYDAIKNMRSRMVAPVDTMGCDRAQYKETDPKVCTFSLNSVELHCETLMSESAVCNFDILDAVFSDKR